MIGITSALALVHMLWCYSAFVGVTVAIILVFQKQHEFSKISISNYLR